jgi:hypothetical protein
MNIQEPLPEAKGLILHCGGSRTTREELTKAPTPEGTRTWYPMPHHDLLEEVSAQLRCCGFKTTAESHGLSHEGKRYFGVMEVALPGRDNETGHSWVVGLRNSHDKTFPAGLVAGTRTFVCDNLAFTGEVKISRKHTKNAWRDVQHLTARAVGQLGDRFLELDRRIQMYKELEVNPAEAHDLMIRALDCRAITASQVAPVLQEWRKPQHDEFAPRNLWSLFNSFTEVYKKQNPTIMLRRSEALHGLCDSLVGVN